MFGQQNDFSKLLEGVNLLAVTQNGVTVAENLLSALEPVLTQGAQRFVQAQTRAAVEKARQILRYEKSLSARARAAKILNDAFAANCRELLAVIK